MKSRTDHDQPLLGMRILVVDDEFLIASVVEDILGEAGAEVVSTATLAAALKAARGEPLSAALLDVRLGRETTESVADVLAARAIPFAFYSGHSLPEPIRQKHPAVPVLLKPVDQNMFVETVQGLVGR